MGINVRPFADERVSFDSSFINDFILGRHMIVMMSMFKG